MPIVVCAKHKQSHDTSQFCFVNGDGAHLSPRKCQCLIVEDGGGNFRPWSPSPDQKRRYRPVEVVNGAPKPLTNKDFIKLMKKQFGRDNPDCPIQDPHGPIDPRSGR